MKLSKNRQKLIEKFDLDINMLEEGYSYGIRVSFYEDSLSSFREHPNIFKFRVGQNEY